MITATIGNNLNVNAILDGNGLSVAITFFYAIDDELSDTSLNPVQNKVIKAAIDEIKRISIQMFQIVISAAERDAIPEEDRREGLRIYVLSEKIEYRLEPDLITWTVVGFDINSQSTAVVNHFNYYVDGVNGSDQNDGKTLATAWKTLTHALLGMPSRIIGSATTLTLGAGTWVFSNTDKEILSRFIIDHRFTIRGTTEVLLAGLSGTRDSENPWKRNFGSALFTDNQYLGCITQDDYPIGKHGSDYLITAASAATTTSIKRLLTTVEFEGDRIMPFLQGNMNMRFEMLNFTYGLIQFINGHNSVQQYFTNVNFLPKSGNLGVYTMGNVVFEKCLFAGAYTTQASINVLRSYLTEINFCIVANTGFGTTNCGITGRNGSIKIDDVLVDGFNRAIRGAGDVEISIQEARYYGLCLLNSDTAFELRSGYFRFSCNNYMNITIPKAMLYMINVNNLLLNAGALRDVQLDLRNCLAGSFTNLHAAGSISYDKLINIEERRAITYPGSGSFLKEYIAYRVVENLTERDAIPPEDRRPGLKVYVISENEEYRLVGGIGNPNWVVLGV